jgi:hypothetical protein
MSQREDDMARLELGPDETTALRESLEIYLRDFRREVAGTENPEFRHALQQRQNILERVLQRLTHSAAA